jgi:hypothetical protein
MKLPPAQSRLCPSVIRMSSSAAAWPMVRGNPSNINPFLASACQMRWQRRQRQARPPDRSFCRRCGAQHVAGGQLRNGQPLSQSCRLGSFPGSGWSQVKQFSLHCLPRSQLVNSLAQKHLSAACRSALLEPPNEIVGGSCQLLSRPRRAVGTRFGWFGDDVHNFAAMAKPGIERYQKSPGTTRRRKRPRGTALTLKADASVRSEEQDFDYRFDSSALAASVLGPCIEDQIRWHYSLGANKSLFQREWSAPL